MASKKKSVEECTIKELKDRFINGFTIISKNRNYHEVWSDLIVMFSISIYNPLLKNFLSRSNSAMKVWEVNEKRYLSIINKYDKQEQNIIVQMFSILIMIYQKMQESNEYCDLLGDIYMNLKISSNNLGQFFTPYDVSFAMAKVTIDKNNIKNAVKEKGYAIINDCACGAGCTLMAGYSVASKLFNRLNPQECLYIVANDIDEIAARMCYIQLSLIPVAAKVTISNSLNEPIVNDVNRVMYTHLNFINSFSVRKETNPCNLFVYEDLKNN